MEDVFEHQKFVSFLFLVSVTMFNDICHPIVQWIFLIIQSFIRFFNQSNNQKKKQLI